MEEAYIDLAVIIVNYNGFEDTIEAIKSIKHQRYPTRIYVVDNNSKNNEAEKISRIFNDAIVLKNRNNLGFAAANNIGIKKAIEDGFNYQLLINNDTAIDENMIANMMKHINSEEVLVPAIFYYDKPERYWYGGGKIDKVQGKAKHLKLREETMVSFATGCCMLLNSSIVKKTGFFDERYFMYYEDLDYSIRLDKANIKIRYIPDAIVWHKDGATSGGDKSSFSIFYNTRNRLNCIKEHDGYFWRIAYPIALASRFIRALQRCAKHDDNWKIIMKAIRDHRTVKWGESVKLYEF